MNKRLRPASIARGAVPSEWFSPRKSLPFGHLHALSATAGGVVGMLALGLVAGGLFSKPHPFFIVTSMGATAVLLFAVPQGILSRPWAVLGGHGISALVGVVCRQMLANDTLAVGLAVGLAIGAMQALRCVHPPGGATALFAVMGPPSIRELGFSYVLTPVLTSAAILVAVAWVFHRPRGAYRLRGETCRGLGNLIRPD